MSKNEKLGIVWPEKEEKRNPLVFSNTYFPKYYLFLSSLFLKESLEFVILKRLFKGLLEFKKREKQNEKEPKDSNT
jgi:hypothetical protein